MKEINSPSSKLVKVGIEESRRGEVLETEVEQFRYSESVALQF